MKNGNEKKMVTVIGVTGDIGICIAGVFALIGDVQVYSLWRRTPLQRDDIKVKGIFVRL